MTIVIVSHRPSYIRACDRQYVLADGRLDEVAASDNNVPRAKAGGSAGGAA